MHDPVSLITTQLILSIRSHTGLKSWIGIGSDMTYFPVWFTILLYFSCHDPTIHDHRHMLSYSRVPSCLYCITQSSELLSGCQDKILSDNPSSANGIKSTKWKWLIMELVFRETVLTGQLLQHHWHGCPSCTINKLISSINVKFKSQLNVFPCYYCTYHLLCFSIVCSFFIVF